MQSPLMHSPYRLPPLAKSNSGGDLVHDIIGKFNSLSVTDKDEERERNERQITKLKAALERAQIVREEAETEARKLREKLLDLQDERQKEKAVLRERASEFEKKYEKAKDRFKLQRAKNEDATRKAQKEHLENEKRHWRAAATAHEEMEWERKLRIDAHDLLEFMEIEQHFVAREETRTIQDNTPVDDVTIRAPEDEEQAIAVEEVQAEEAVVEDIEEDIPVIEVKTEELEDEDTAPITSTGQHDQRLDGEFEWDHLPQPQEAQTQLEPSPSAPILTPRKQFTRIPVVFGDDKENQTPVSHSHCQVDSSQTVEDVLKTPLTIDRAAALAAIQYRRGRAKSFMNAQMTPKQLAIVDRRDVSAPPLVTMTVGRKVTG